MLGTGRMTLLSLPDRDQLGNVGWIVQINSCDGTIGDGLEGKDTVSQRCEISNEDSGVGQNGR